MIQAQHNQREYLVIQKLLRYDAFVLTLDVLESLRGTGGHIVKSELNRIVEILPVVEPVFSTVQKLKRKEWTIERAKNAVEFTRQTIAQHVSQTINGKYTRILSMGLPTALENGLKGAANIEIRCIHPTLGGNEIEGFVERCQPFFDHTAGAIVHLAQCNNHVDWADAIFLDTFGASFSAFVREGTDMVTYLAYGRKPLFLLMAEGSQWTSDRDLYGSPIAPDNFQFLLTENGVFQYDPSAYSLKKRWTFSKRE